MEVDEQTDRQERVIATKLEVRKFVDRGDLVATIYRWQELVDDNYQN